MANGDAALAAGFQPVAPGADLRLGYDDINRLADWTTGRTADTGWTNPGGLSSGWTVHDALTDPVVMRVKGGLLHLSGRVGKSTTAGTIVMMLPAGFRPSRVALVVTPHDGGLAKIWVGPDGKVEVLGSAGQAFTGISLTIPPLPVSNT